MNKKFKIKHKFAACSVFGSVNYNINVLYSDFDLDYEHGFASFHTVSVIFGHAWSSRSALRSFGSFCSHRQTSCVFSSTCRGRWWTTAAAGGLSRVKNCSSKYTISQEIRKNINICGLPSLASSSTLKSQYFFLHPEEPWNFSRMLSHSKHTLLLCNYLPYLNPQCCPEYHRLSSSTWKREHSKHLHCLWIICWRSSGVPEKSNFSLYDADLCFFRSILSALRVHHTRTEPPASGGRAPQMQVSVSRSGAPTSARLRSALSLSNQLRSS